MIRASRLMPTPVNATAMCIRTIFHGCCWCSLLSLLVRPPAGMPANRNGTWPLLLPAAQFESRRFRLLPPAQSVATGRFRCLLLKPELHVVVCSTLNVGHECSFHIAQSWFRKFRQGFKWRLCSPAA